MAAEWKLDERAQNLDRDSHSIPTEGCGSICEAKSRRVVVDREGGRAERDSVPVMTTIALAEIY